jgi:tryptophan 7-halogenase
MVVNLDSNKTEVVVVGGGTAGWITALYVKRCYPNIKITLIESSDIGILGAGEGTTPHFIALLEELQLTTKDILEFADGTIKNGIKFTNWNGDGKSFYHGFNTIQDLNHEQVFNINYCQDSLIALNEISNGNNLNKIEFCANACERNAVIIANIDLKTKDISYDRLGDFALHFNAVKLAEFLKKVGIKRNIKVIDGVVDKINNDNDGYITYLTLKDGTNVTCDFVFDCTGFKRLIVGKHFNSEWKSYKEYLPLNRAMPFFKEIDKDFIPPFTESIAMKYGWVWKIPLQNRYGCGYVFDSNSITDEQAVEEIKSVFGDGVTLPGKTFSFEPGAYKKQWIKNCIAIGLAGGFVEPLEATNIWVIILSLRNLLTRIKGLTERDEVQLGLYNDTLFKFTEDILTFLNFHYHTQRADTSFWQNFKTRCKVPEQVQTIINNNRDVTATAAAIKDNIFTTGSWVQVGAGTGFFNKEEASKSFASLHSGIRKDAYHMLKQTYFTNIRNMTERCSDHKEFISMILAKDVENI